MKVDQELKESLDEFGDAMDQILGCRNASDTFDVPLVNDDSVEPEFTVGNASYVKIKINLEEIADLLVGAN